MNIRTRWLDYIENIVPLWNRLGLHPSEAKEVVEDREVWRLNLKLLPRSPHGKAGEKNDDELWSQQSVAYLYGKLPVLRCTVAYRTAILVELPYQYDTGISK